MSMIAVATGADMVREAIMAGNRRWTQALMVSVRLSHSARINAVGYEKDKSKADLLRSLCRELYMTPEEITARYDLTWTGPYSRSYEQDDEGNSRPVPLDRADYHGYDWQARPKRQPLAGAVYVVKVPLAGDTLTIPVLAAAFSFVVDAHQGRYPTRLRLDHTSYTDFANLLVRSYPWTNGGRRDDWDGFEFNGVPVGSQRGAPALTLLAVYPLR